MKLRRNYIVLIRTGQYGGLSGQIMFPIIPKLLYCIKVRNCLQQYTYIVKQVSALTGVL
jgi:hypothetical protein